MDERARRRESETAGLLKSPPMAPPHHCWRTPEGGMLSLLEAPWWNLEEGNRQWCIMLSLLLLPQCIMGRISQSHPPISPHQAPPIRRSSQLSPWREEETFHPCGYSAPSFLKKNETTNVNDTQKNDCNSDVLCSREQTGCVCVTVGVQMLLYLLSPILIDKKRRDEEMIWTHKMKCFKDSWTKL